MIIGFAFTAVKARQHTLKKLRRPDRLWPESAGECKSPSSCTCVGRGVGTAVWSMVQLADLSAFWAHGAGLLQSSR